MKKAKKAKSRRRYHRQGRVTYFTEDELQSYRADLQDKADAYNLWMEKIKDRIRMERMLGIDTFTYDYATEYAKEAGKIQDKADAMNFWLDRRVALLVQN